jgi:hypothetical protein
MTSHRIGMENIKTVIDGSKISMGNGSQEEIEEIADVNGTITVNDKQKKISLHDVTIFRNRRFELFSISQMLKKEWAHAGNK